MIDAWNKQVLKNLVDEIFLKCTSIDDVTNTFTEIIHTTLAESYMRKYTILSDINNSNKV
jgi:hypothetical protein